MKTWLKLVIGGAVVVVILAGVGVWWFLRDDAPAEVTLDKAVESVATTTTTPGETAPASPVGIAGTWAIDTASGAFDFESASGTFVGFRIQEQLAAIGSATAVGRTGDITGSLTIDGSTLTAATFTVDLTTITTNDSRRDDRVQSALQTGTFPTGTFTLTTPIDLGPTAAEGEPISVTGVGDLTIHGVTRQISLPIEAQLVDGTIAVTGSVDITFSDYDVEVPSSPIVVSAEDHGILEMQLLFTKT